MTANELLPPNFTKLDTALRSIGYSFEAAVADVVDNSIDAKAGNIMVRLITRSKGQFDLAIWDDGSGMSENTLKEAMRFGSDVSQQLDRLGKFGLGLKLASLSQAKELHVVSARDGALAGRAWLETGIASGFTSTVYAASDCPKLLAAVGQDCNFKSSGTVVLWSRLYRVGQNHVNPEEHAQKLMHRLENYLSLAFHRFLAGHPRKVDIRLDIFDSESETAGIPASLDPLDPFGYDQTGHAAFPAPMYLQDTYRDRVKIKAHIWPPNSSSPSYRLPGGANARQGFYFYRNDRLIQGGGWNGIRETEPHSSLARLEVDIAADFDVEVSLDVKKSEIHLPTAFVQAIQKARTSSGVDLKKYLALAEVAYRTRKPTDAELPLIPSAGLPAPLQKFLHRELRIKSTTKHKDLKIQWKAMGRQSFFEIDRDRGYLYINRTYRRNLLHGLPGSAADIPVVKSLLFLLLQDLFASERLGGKMRERMEQANRILVQAVKYERCPD